MFRSHLIFDATLAVEEQYATTTNQPIKARAYSTAINATTSYLVREVKCKLASDYSTTFIEDDTYFRVQVNNHRSAAGKTKAMHRVSTA